MSIFRLIVLCLVGTFCGACATEKHGVYRVLHKESIASDYEMRLLKHEESVRFYVEFKGEPICEMEINPQEIRSVVSHYRSGCFKTENLTTTYDGNKISTIRWTTRGTNTVVLSDLDGDGFPEMRVTREGENNRIERLKPVVLPSNLMK